MSPCYRESESIKLKPLRKRKREKEKERENGSERMSFVSTIFEN